MQAGACGMMESFKAVRKAQSWRFAVILISQLFDRSGCHSRCSPCQCQTDVRSCFPGSCSDDGASEGSSVSVMNGSALGRVPLPENDEGRPRPGRGVMGVGGRASAACRHRRVRRGGGLAPCGGHRPQLLPQQPVQRRAVARAQRRQRAGLQAAHHLRTPPMAGHRFEDGGEHSRARIMGTGRGGALAPQRPALAQPGMNYGEKQDPCTTQTRPEAGSQPPGVRRRRSPWS